jgi:hypothetical protein
MLFDLDVSPTVAAIAAAAWHAGVTPTRRTLTRSVQGRSWRARC